MKTPSYYESVRWRARGAPPGIDEMWMHCEACWPEAYCTYVGGHTASRAPIIAGHPPSTGGSQRDSARGASPAAGSSTHFAFSTDATQVRDQPSRRIDGPFPGRHEADEKDGEDAGKKYAVECARPADRCDRGAETPDFAEVQQVGPDKRAEAA